MPVDRGDIDAQLREIGEGERWWEQREFRDLPYVLHTGERIRGLVHGFVLGPRRPRLFRRRPWVIVATDERLICLKQERFGRKQVDVNLEQVTGVHHRSGMREYRITLLTPHRKYRLRIRKEDAFRFLGVLAPLTSHLAAPASRVPGAPRLPGMAAFGTIPALSGLATRVSMLTVPDHATRADVARLEATVERLEKEVERLGQQVEFLEGLLHQRAAGALPVRDGSPES